MIFLPHIWIMAGLLGLHIFECEDKIKDNEFELYGISNNLVGKILISMLGFIWLLFGIALVLDLSKTERKLFWKYFFLRK